MSTEMGTPTWSLPALHPAVLRLYVFLNDGTGALKAGQLVDTGTDEYQIVAADPEMATASSISWSRTRGPTPVRKART